VDVFWKRSGNQVVCMNLLTCADWLLAFFARVTLKLNSLLSVAPKV
jgi:hypothetical protein